MVFSCSSPVITTWAMPSRYHADKSFHIQSMTWICYCYPHSPGTVTAHNLLLSAHSTTLLWVVQNHMLQKWEAIIILQRRRPKVVFNIHVYNTGWTHRLLFMITLYIQILERVIESYFFLHIEKTTQQSCMLHTPPFLITSMKVERTAKHEAKIWNYITSSGKHKWYLFCRYELCYFTARKTIFIVAVIDHCGWSFQM